MGEGVPGLWTWWPHADPSARYHSLTRQLLRKAEGVVLMYDITSPESFTHVRYWLDCLQVSVFGAVDWPQVSESRGSLESTHTRSSFLRHYKWHRSHRSDTAGRGTCGWTN